MAHLISPPVSFLHRGLSSAAWQLLFPFENLQTSGCNRLPVSRFSPNSFFTPLTVPQFCAASTLFPFPDFFFASFPRCPAEILASAHVFFFCRLQSYRFSLFRLFSKYWRFPAGYPFRDGETPLFCLSFLSDHWLSSYGELWFRVIFFEGEACSEVSLDFLD